MASVRATKAKTHKGGGKGKIRHMLIKHAKNGFTSQIHRDRNPGQPYMGDDEDAPMIHGSVSHLAKHVKATFGGGDPGDDDMPAASAEVDK